MRHAELLTDRILFLEGLPNYQRLFPLHIGQTLQEMFQADMEIKVAAVKRLCDGAAHMREVGEITSTRLFKEILCRRGAPHRLSQDPAFTPGQAGRAAVRRPTGRRSGARRHRPAPGYGSRPISRCPWRISSRECATTSYVVPRNKVEGTRRGASSTPRDRAVITPRPHHWVPIGSGARPPT
jgi:hypothetical protein